MFFFKSSKPLVFLHRCLQNLSAVVCYLSCITLLPPALFLAIIQSSFFSPPHVTALVLLITFFMTTFPSETPLTMLPNPSGHASPISEKIQDLIRFYFNSKLKHFVFGLCKGAQSLTVISYIRASCSLRMTYRTPVSAFIIGCLSTIASYFGCKHSSPKSAHIAYETIDFVFNSATAVGFLSLLNQSGPWSLTSLGVGFLVLTCLSIFVETDAYQRANTAICDTIRSLSPSKTTNRVVLSRQFENTSKKYNNAQIKRNDAHRAKSDSAASKTIKLLLNAGLLSS